MKKLKTIISLATITVLIFINAFVLSFPTSAAASVGITPNGTTVDITRTIKVKISITSSDEILNITSTLNYDASKLSYIGVEGADPEPTNGKIIFWDENFSLNPTSASYTVSFKALTTGNVTITYLGNISKAINDLPVNEDVSGSATFTIVDPSLSNADLTSLTVSGTKLSPAFSPATTNYNATVEYETEKITVNASAADGLTVEGGGNVNLNVGNNKHTVTVTSKDGKTKKVYTINIKRLAEGEELTPETSEPETPDEDTPSVDVLQVQIGDKSYHILDKLPENTEAPAGFETTTTDYNGVTVPVFSSERKEYILYSLRNDADQTVDFYTYDSIRDEFLLLPYMNINERMFIFAKADENLAAPVGYNESYIPLGNSEVKVYTSERSSLSDFCVIYCFVDGKYTFYTYDLLEKTIQRTPEFELLKIGDTNTSTIPEKPANWLEAFQRISNKGKAVIFTLFVVVACIIAIIVLLIIRAYNSRGYDIEGVAFEPDNEYDSFDDIEIINNSENNFQDEIIVPEETEIPETETTESAPEKE